MDQIHGRILSIQADRATAMVQVDAAIVCARCSAGKGCGAGLLATDRGPRRFEAPIVGRLDVREGDDVRIELAPQSVLSAALTVYGLPLAAALIAAATAWVLGASDGVAVAAVIAGIVAGVTIGRRRLKRSSCLKRFTPTIVASVTQPLAGAQ